MKQPEVIGAQLFYVEVECHKHIVTAIEKIEKEGMAVIQVTPLVDYDVADGKTALRAVIITVAVEARPLKALKRNVGKKDSNAG